MEKWLDFFRDIINSVVDDKSLHFGVCKAVDILLDLKIADETIKQALVKHFNIYYNEAECVLKEVKEYRNNNS